MNKTSIKTCIHACKNYFLSAYSALVPLLGAGDVKISKADIVLALL